MNTSERNAALAEIEREIIAAEGPYYVQGRYYALEPWRARRIAAERILAARERRRAIALRQARALKAREQREQLASGYLLGPWPAPAPLPSLPTPRQMAERQMAEFRERGFVTTTGYEA